MENTYINGGTLKKRGRRHDGSILNHYNHGRSSRHACSRECVSPVIDVSLVW